MASTTPSASAASRKTYPDRWIQSHPASGTEMSPADGTRSLGIAQAPAEPDRLPVALGRDVDQPALEVAHHSPNRLEVRQQALDPLTDLRELGFASVDLAVRPAVLRRVLFVQRRQRIVESALLDRQLQP